jgi:3-oxoacyl-[acyl-carrier-protein] synthase-3
MPASALKICLVAAYLPERVVTNDHLARLCSREPGWFESVTGIQSRRRATDGENANTMAIRAVESLAATSRIPLSSVDLVLGASYTPWDTVGTIAHRVQRRFGIAHARALYLSSACSSFFNALEIAQSFAAVGKSARALIVLAEHNSAYSSDEDHRSGHLWGDGAAAILVSANPDDHGILELLNIQTHGLGHLGAGPDGVYLKPRGEGLVMPNGRDVFEHACREMARAARDALASARLTSNDIALFVPHQANKRIIARVAKALNFSDERVAMTIERFGNTGCASIPITYALGGRSASAGEYVLMAAFGGGYSSGAGIFRAL